MKTALKFMSDEVQVTFYENFVKIYGPRGRQVKQTLSNLFNFAYASKVTLESRENFRSLNAGRIHLNWLENHESVRWELWKCFEFFGSAFFEFQ
jgi:hypothetical protein